MAKFVTYIADPDLETSVIKAIASINGELFMRGVSLNQIKETETEKDITLICTRQIDFAFKRVIVNKNMSADEISQLLQPNETLPKFSIDVGNSKIKCFVGLSGGAGTTTLAINHAFERAQEVSTILVDLDNHNPDIAKALGLHRIENRNEKITNNLYAVQGTPQRGDYKEYVFDLGNDLNHLLLRRADEIFLITKLGFNTLSRLQTIEFSPTTTIFNFSERTKTQLRWRQQIEEHFPRMNFINIPLDPKSFEMAAENKSALIEVAANSLARKSIATLG